MWQLSRRRLHQQGGVERNMCRSYIVLQRTVRGPDKSQRPLPCCLCLLQVWHNLNLKAIADPVPGDQDGSYMTMFSIPGLEFGFIFFCLLSSVRSGQAR